MSSPAISPRVVTDSTEKKEIKKQKIEEFRHRTTAHGTILAAAIMGFIAYICSNITAVKSPKASCDDFWVMTVLLLLLTVFFLWCSAELSRIFFLNPPTVTPAPTPTSTPRPTPTAPRPRPRPTTVGVELPWTASDVGASHQPRPSIPTSQTRASRPFPLQQPASQQPRSVRPGTEGGELPRTASDTGASHQPSPSRPTSQSRPSRPSPLQLPRSPRPAPEEDPQLCGDPDKAVPLPILLVLKLIKWFEGLEMPVSICVVFTVVFVVGLVVSFNLSLCHHRDPCPPAQPIVCPPPPSTVDAPPPGNRTVDGPPRGNRTVDGPPPGNRTVDGPPPGTRTVDAPPPGTPPSPGTRTAPPRHRPHRPRRPPAATPDHNPSPNPFDETPMFFQMRKADDDTETDAEMGGPRWPPATTLYHDPFTMSLEISESDEEDRDREGGYGH